MKRLLFGVVAVLLATSGCSSGQEEAVREIEEAADQAMPSYAEEAGEWVALFDGETLEGWERLNGEHEYEVVDGAIVGTTVPDEPNGFLCTTRDYADFILEFDVQVDSLLNSGVQFRSLSSPDYQDGRVHGYQVEIEEESPNRSGGIYDEARRGEFLNEEWLSDIDEVWRHGDWNAYRVEAIGSNLRTWINGAPAVAIEDTVTAEGFICLQVHSTDHQEPLHARWRNLRVMEL